jgi:hypothetical protein
MIRIQKNVPLPSTKSRGRNGGRPFKYPWSQMEVGDSFLVPDGVGRAAHTLVMSASSLARRFVARKTDEGYRCWRVS